ncbi:hypothetical protein DBR23_10015 [Acidovorax sp. HMWF018]|uniref:YdaU family protein n=1 Tax=Acidovorax sp. HMWF018 TaxID=2056855 RepID=UPI000D38F247|nr:YdaU family protein [Acidovorax sp. HMWF018]PTT39834.1 hypothetical protein DBR23_10015 [Acidovorax sp. HMWF018]
MNYYPFHIGDYLSATRHLTWTEDAAYRRLLDTYYTTEKPLPTELRAVCRLVLATTDEQREAVEVVLNEFFELTSAGWINVRADAEIDSMRVKQSAQEDKDRHETERMRRYRERRAQMFAALRAVEVVPAWDVPMKELQRLFEQHCNTPATPANPPETPPATDLQREQVVSSDEPATAISTNTNTNTNKEEERAPRKRAATPSQPDIAKPDDVEPQTWADFLKLRKAKRAPVTQTVVDEAKRECAKAGMTLEGFLRVWCRRGSQGLEAAWLKPDERAQGQAAVETPYQRSMRERMQEAAPEIARRAPTAPQQDAADFFRTVDAQSRVVDVKAIEVTT